MEQTGLTRRDVLKASVSLALASALHLWPLSAIAQPTDGPFAIYRSPAGEQAVLQENMFVEEQCEVIREMR